jgi:hypothetical protein
MSAVKRRSATRLVRVGFRRSETKNLKSEIRQQKSWSTLMPEIVGGCTCPALLRLRLAGKQRRHGACAFWLDSMGRSDAAGDSRGISVPMM